MLGLRVNHPRAQEQLELELSQPATRAEAAYSIARLLTITPSDLDGVYLRNTPNQVHQPLGYFHPFDGDGMLHRIEFRNGQASYRNRWVRTRGFEAEQEAEGSMWGGFVDPPHLSHRNGVGFSGRLKDASNTDIIVVASG